MLKIIDKIYFQIRDAFNVLIGRESLNHVRNVGLETGEWLAGHKIMQALDVSDPHEFQNMHFRLGYYYAYETAKKVTRGNDHDLD